MQQTNWNYNLYWNSIVNSAEHIHDVKYDDVKMLFLECRKWKTACKNYNAIILFKKGDVRVEINLSNIYMTYNNFKKVLLENGVEIIKKESSLDDLKQFNKNINKYKTLINLF